MDTHKSLVQFRERWAAVAALEGEELRATSLEQRWRQLNAIVGLAIGLGIALESDREEGAVRQRWARLKGGGGLQ